MGLGLTIVKKILDDHEAAVRAESVQPQGCRFVVEFTHPHSRGDLDRPVRVSGFRRRQKQSKILCVLRDFVVK